MTILEKKLNEALKPNEAKAKLKRIDLIVSMLELDADDRIEKQERYLDILLDNLVDLGETERYLGTITEAIQHLNKLKEAQGAVLSLVEFLNREQEIEE